MHFSRRHLIRLLTLGGSATIATAGWQRSVKSQEFQNWTLVSVWDSSSFIYPYLESFVAQINTQTQGQLQIKLSSPTDPRLMLEQVGTGRFSMGHGMPLLWENLLPAAPYLMALPFGLTAPEQWLWLTQAGGQALGDEIYGSVGCKYFPGGNLGLSSGGWFKTEIKDLSNLDGLKINSSGLAAAVWQAAGAEVVTLSITELQRQLANDRLGAAEYVGPQQDLKAQLYRSAPFYYFPGWQRPGTLLDFFIHLETWQALPPPLQAALETAIVAFNQTLLNEQIYQNQQALRVLTRQHGVQLRTFPEPVLLRLESLTGQLLQERATADPQVAQVLDSLIRFRSDLLPWVETVERSYLTARRWTWTR